MTRAVRSLIVVGAAASIAGLTFVAPRAPARAAPRAEVTTGSWAAPEVGPAVQAPVEEAAWGGVLRGALAVCAAFLVAMMPMQGAEAARSGGRMGGATSARARPPPPRSTAGATRSSGPRISSGPNVSIGIGAPMYSPFGFSPFGFSPFGGFGLFGPPLPLPVPSGPSNTDQMIQNQQLQDERKLDEQKQEIAALQKEIQALKAQRQ
eukprot:gb/GFBE01065045.1/.p1 GENE.gb/GFBE01065045.1/~~gb/GFBE01065045.1/.p1  ORF type:complete len:207 (+),score=28.93 gb/GFBE01065045.1/:1-621(+)